VPLLRFDPDARASLLALQANPARRPLFLAVKEVLLQLRDDEGEPPRAIALRVAGGGHGYHVPVYAAQESWAVGWKRLEDGSRGILYIGPSSL
jgi:hypothetical protein